MDGDGLTPLFTAAFNSNDVVTYELLRHGAEHRASKLGGFSALHYAAMRNCTFMSRLLDAQGPDFEAFYKASTHDLSTQLLHAATLKRLPALPVRINWLLFQENRD